MDVQPCPRTGCTTPALSRGNFASTRYRGYIKIRWRKNPMAHIQSFEVGRSFIMHWRRGPIMLNENIVAVLAALPFQPDAEWGVNILPFGSISWKDEMPAIADLFDRPEDMAIVHAMFGMRLKSWDGEELNA